MILTLGSPEPVPDDGRFNAYCAVCGGNVPCTHWRCFESFRPAYSRALMIEAVSLALESMARHQ
jgi:hypothetical protein